MSSTKVKQVLQSNSFRKAVKRLNRQQKGDLDKAIRLVMADPSVGDQKKGDLSFMQVYKFKMEKQLTLLGYSYNKGTLVLELLALGPHENFYRDAKR